jgi:hypothetical protein
MHNEDVNRVTQVYSTINRAEELGFLTDAKVAAADTKQGLINAINATVVHADQENWKAELIRAIKVSGIADSDITSLTTIAGLVALLGIPAVTSQEVLS